MNEKEFFFPFPYPEDSKVSYSSMFSNLPPVYQLSTPSFPSLRRRRPDLDSHGKVAEASEWENIFPLTLSSAGETL